MELYLSFFPIYVLLLLLSLSQGRPPHVGSEGGNPSSLLRDKGWTTRDKSLPWDRQLEQEEEDDFEEEDDQTRFKNNILKELGLEDAYIPNNSKVSLFLSPTLCLFHFHSHELYEIS